MKIFCSSGRWSFSCFAWRFSTCVRISLSHLGTPLWNEPLDTPSRGTRVLIASPSYCAFIALDDFPQKQLECTRQTVFINAMMSFPVQTALPCTDYYFQISSDEMLKNFWCTARNLLLKFQLLSFTIVVSDFSSAAVATDITNWDYELSSWPFPNQLIF